MPTSAYNYQSKKTSYHGPSSRFTCYSVMLSMSHSSIFLYCQVDNALPRIHHLPGSISKPIQKTMPKNQEFFI